MSKTITDLYLLCFPSKIFLHTGQYRKACFAVKAIKTCRCQLMEFCREAWILWLVLGTLPVLLPPVYILLVSNVFNIYLSVSSLFLIAFSCGIHCMAFLSNLWTGLWNIIFASWSALQRAATQKKVIAVHCTCIILEEEKILSFF